MVIEFVVWTWYTLGTLVVTVWECKEGQGPILDSVGSALHTLFLRLLVGRQPALSGCHGGSAVAVVTAGGRLDMSIMISSVGGAFHCIDVLSVSTLRWGVFPCLGIARHCQSIRIARCILHSGRVVCSLSASVGRFVAVSPRLRCCCLLLCALSVSLRCELDPVLTGVGFWTCGHGCSIVSGSGRIGGFGFSLSCGAGCGIHHGSRFERLTHLVPGMWWRASEIFAALVLIAACSLVRV